MSLILNNEGGDHQGMIYRTLGRTGEKVSAIGVGGAHIGLPKMDEQLVSASFGPP